MQTSGTEISRRRLIGLGAILLSSALFLGAGGPPPQAQSPEGIEVRFSQLNWLESKGKARFPQSRVGVAELSFRPEAAPLLVGEGGFVNIVIQAPNGKAEWAVRNLFLRYKDERFMLGSEPGVQFDLTTPNGKRVPRLRYHLTFTREPLSDPPSGPLRRAPVALENYKVGGRYGAGSEIAATPLMIKAWGFSEVSEVEIEIGEDASTLVPVADLPEVQEDEDGCAPASVARSIRYMLENAGAEEPDSAQSIYESLYDLMNTNARIDDAGEIIRGTSDEDIVDGKQAYSDANGLDIDTTLTGIGGIGNAMDILAGGGDVEVLITWFDENGDPAGGHAAMIVSIVDLGNGYYQITYIDDADQTDNDPNNDTHVIVIGPDGSFNGGRVDGLLMETMPGAGRPAISTTPTPTPSPKPTPTLPSGLSAVSGG